MQGTDGASAVAVVGAVTGIVALVWNIWRAVREGPRLHVDAYVYNVESPNRTGAVAEISLTNAGTVPAYVSEVAFVDNPPWHLRWPFIRTASNRTLRRWWLRWLVKRGSWTSWTAHTDPDVTGRIEPGELRAGEVKDQRMSGELKEMTTARVESQILQSGRWLVVETGLRRYVSRVVDSREM